MVDGLLYLPFGLVGQSRIVVGAGRQSLLYCGRELPGQVGNRRFPQHGGVPAADVMNRHPAASETPPAQIRCLGV
jgi:hypothetical protein